MKNKIKLTKNIKNKWKSAINYLKANNELGFLMALDDLNREIELENERAGNVINALEEKTAVYLALYDHYNKLVAVVGNKVHQKLLDLALSFADYNNRALKNNEIITMPYRHSMDFSQCINFFLPEVSAKTVKGELKVPAAGVRNYLPAEQFYKALEIKEAQQALNFKRASKEYLENRQEAETIKPKVKILAAVNKVLDIFKNGLLKSFKFNLFATKTKLAVVDNKTALKQAYAQLNTDREKECKQKAATLPPSMKLLGEKYYRQNYQKRANSMPSFKQVKPEFRTTYSNHKRHSL